MLDHLFGLLLIGLGLQTPSVPPSVLGDETTLEQTVDESTSSSQRGKKSDSDKKLGTVQQLKEGKMASRGAMLEQKKASWEQYKEQIKTTRENAQETFKAQREAFKTRLATIKDEKKKTVVENADARLSEVNTKRTEMMTETLAKMDEVITKLNDRVATLKAEGKDTVSAETAISAAQVAITSAKSAVTTQAGKEYIIGVTSENNLKTDVGRAISGLEKDLKAVHETIKTTRATVTKAIQAVALLVGKKEGQP